MERITCLRLLSALSVILATATAAAETTLFFEDFEKGGDSEKLPKGWWAEGGEKVWVADGKLHVRANAEGRVAKDRSNVSNYVCTVWNETEFKGDIRVEFDAHVVASVPGVNNINFFLLYSDPSGKPIYETRAARVSGDYHFYHTLNGYIVTFLQGQEHIRTYHPDGTAKARFRMRRCPGFRLIHETFGHHCRKSVTYHITFTKKRGVLTYAVDGTTCLRAEDPEPLTHGIIGLRTFRTELWWDNIKVVGLD